jgi:hypothetical protein
LKSLFNWFVSAWVVMKRSSSPHSSSFHPTSEHQTHNSNSKRQKINNSSTKNEQDSMGTVVLPYINDLLQNFEQGHYDQCLKGFPPALDQLSTDDRQSISAIEATIKALVERHVRLETENLRYQVALRQQQQLLSPAPPIPSEAQDASEPAIKPERNGSALLPITPEDGIWSMREQSVLDKVKTKSSVFPPLSLTGYFCT